MHKLRSAFAVLLTAAVFLTLLAGCKVVDIPDDVWFNSSSSSSSFVEQLAALDEAEPVDDGDYLYYDALNGARLYTSPNPDTTFSLIYETADGQRTRVFTTSERRTILFPLMNEAGTKAAFLVMANGGQIKEGAYIGQLYTVSLPDGQPEAQSLYIRSYSDFPRGFSWYDDDTLFISSAVESTGAQEDVIGFFSISNGEVNNIVGGEHPVDIARQGVISPDGKLIAYSGYYSTNDRFANCIFDLETGETTYWYDRTNSGLTSTSDAMICYRFIDNEHIVKLRTYTMYLDAEGNIVSDIPSSGDEEVSDPDEVIQESVAEDAIDEVTGETISQEEAASEDSETGESAASEDASSAESSPETAEPKQIVVNSICTMNVYTGELSMLIEHAYNPVVNAAGTKLYFHYTSFNTSVGTDDLTHRVFCYDLATGEITEVTQSMGITSSFDVLKLEQRINGYTGE